MGPGLEDSGAKRLRRAEMGGSDVDACPSASQTNGSTTDPMPLSPDPKHKTRAGSLSIPYPTDGGLEDSTPGDPPTFLCVLGKSHVLRDEVPFFQKTEVTEVGAQVFSGASLPVPGPWGGRGQTEPSGETYCPARTA